MIFTILVTLLWFNPSDSKWNAFRISHLNGKALIFATHEQCLDHIILYERYIRLYIKHIHDDKAIAGDIYCDAILSEDANAHISDRNIKSIRAAKDRKR